ncbi:MAG: DNA gyrase subunit A [Defluviitaleaceae bacterium]|nr:DNA gyrase subunit A [Defluviitaleaceae bacterium]
MNENILQAKLEHEMKDAYIHYAMSVITSRALPDARDGLKPVQRRILHTMNELGFTADKPHKKSARTTGDTMGRYHPHGNASIYAAMVRMAQDFSFRYMLVDGHGNFGSIDGYPAAAERYTEARMSKPAMELMADIEKNTVDFVANYDGEFKEPTVLPAKIPNLLINGAAGIAVGMMTSIPPHNLREVISALLDIIENEKAGKDTDLSDITSHIKGPDFPTGASILGMDGIRRAYSTGRGKIIVRAKCEIEQVGTRTAIVVTELPYMVNKTSLVEKIGELVKDKKVDGLHDLTDESDRLGIRIVIELKKDANANVVLNNLYKHCQLQSTFGANMLALVKGEPKVLNLKELLYIYLEHQREVITRRTKFDLDKALARAHIVEGFIKALDVIDEIITIIRANREIAASKEIIMDRFGFSKEQADAIVEMRLRALSGLERERLENELKDLKVKIEELTHILNDTSALLDVISTELKTINDKYGDDRRTILMPNSAEIDTLDLIEDEVCVITQTHLDYIKRVPATTYKTQNRGGKGVIGMGTREEDMVKTMVTVSSHDDLLFFTNHGRVYNVKAYEIPMSGRGAKGTPAVNLCSLAEGERVAAIIPLRDYEDGNITMVTEKGMIKKVALSRYAKIRSAGKNIINVADGDSLCAALRTSAGQEILLATSLGMGIRFQSDKVRESVSGSGVRGIRLAESDSVIGVIVAPLTNPDGEKLLLVCEKGFGKTVEFDEFRITGRGGKGVKVCTITDKTGNVAALTTVKPSDEVMIINSEGVIIRIKGDTIRTVGRAAQGVRLISMNPGTTVAGLAVVDATDLADEETDETDTTAEAVMEAGNE